MNDLRDTNIVTRLAEPGHAMHQAARVAVRLLVKLLAQTGHKLHIVSENHLRVLGRLHSAHRT